MFIDDLHEARANITELTRRLHELEIELRRLENEREELTAAYKEAEAVSTIHVPLSLWYPHLRQSMILPVTVVVIEATQFSQIYKVLSTYV